MFILQNSLTNLQNTLHVFMLQNSLTNLQNTWHVFMLQNSLTNLQKAIKGYVVMSEQLDAVYNSFLNNQVCGGTDLLVEQ